MPANGVRSNGSSVLPCVIGLWAYFYRHFCNPFLQRVEDAIAPPPPGVLVAARRQLCRWRCYREEAGACSRRVEDAIAPPLPGVWWRLDDSRVDGVVVRRRQGVVAGLSKTLLLLRYQELLVAARRQSCRWHCCKEEAGACSRSVEDAIAPPLPGVWWRLDDSRVDDIVVRRRLGAVAGLSKTLSLLRYQGVGGGSTTVVSMALL